MNAPIELQLSHFSDKPVGEITPCSQSRADRFKPRGLWVSVDGEDDWESWCVQEDFRLDQLAVRHRVTLAPNANILWLATADEVTAFGAQYPAPDIWSDYALDWPSVSERYDGIIIAPYQWSCRLAKETRWYYGWDCASGCVWHPRAIASIVVAADLLREVA